MGILSVVVLMVLAGAAFGGTPTRFPTGYILDVSPDCRTEAQGSAIVTVKSDLPVTVSTTCDSGTDNGITVESDKVTYKASLGYSAGTCVFVSDTVNGVKTYTSTVIVAWGGDGAELLSESERWLVTCSFDANGDATVSSKTVGSALLAPSELQNNQGSATADTLTLQLTDVLDDEITGSSVPLGKMVRLTGTLVGAAFGLRATSCDAVGNTDSTKVKILAGGCGDGRVFPISTGFTTTGKTLVSPFFPYFKIDGNTGVSFTCNFTTCAAKLCNGDSCASRRKRSGAPGIQLEAGTSSIIASSKIPGSSGARLLMVKERENGIGMSSNVLTIGAVAATLSVVSICISLYACIRRKGVKDPAIVMKS